MASQVYENKQAFEQLFEKSFHHEALYGSAILTAEKNIKYDAKFKACTKYS